MLLTWKILFNPGLSRQAQKKISRKSSRKCSRVDHPADTFIKSTIVRTACQKDVGLYLDEKLNLSYYIKAKISNVCKDIGAIKKMYYNLPKNSLLTIYKSFIRPHLDYSDIPYDLPKNQSFINKMENVQYNATLVMQHWPLLELFEVHQG